MMSAAPPPALPAVSAVSAPLGGAGPEVTQYLAAMRGGFPPYLNMGPAPYLALPGHLPMPAFPGMPGPPHNGKLEHDHHNKVSNIFLLSIIGN